MIIECRKLIMHIEQAQCDQAKMELSNKSWLDQHHYNIEATMLIHIWNEQPDMQANKLKYKVSFACPTLNQCTQQVCI